MTFCDNLKSFGHFDDEIEALNSLYFARNTGKKHLEQRINKSLMIHGLSNNIVFDMELGLIPIFTMFIMQVLFILYGLTGLQRMPDDLLKLMRTKCLQT